MELLNGILYLHELLGLGVAGGGFLDSLALLYTARVMGCYPLLVLLIIY